MAREGGGGEGGTAASYAAVTMTTSPSPPRSSWDLPRVGGEVVLLRGWSRGMGAAVGSGGLRQPLPPLVSSPPLHPLSFVGIPLPTTNAPQILRPAASPTARGEGGGALPTALPPCRLCSRGGGAGRQRRGAGGGPRGGCMARGEGGIGADAWEGAVGCWDTGAGGRGHHVCRRGGPGDSGGLGRARGPCPWWGRPPGGTAGGADRDFTRWATSVWAGQVGGVVRQFVRRGEDEWSGCPPERGKRENLM